MAWNVDAKGTRRFLPALLILMLSVSLAGHWWTATPSWTPDGIYYQAQLREVEGEGRHQALVRTLTRPEWSAEARHPEVAFESARFYRRRWTVPILGAAFHPVFGSRSLEIVSLLGYVTAGLLLYLLLLRRFGRWESALAVAACLLLPPFREWSFHPLTDSWGVALEAAALLSAVLTLDRGCRWLAMWVASITALTFTRDAVIVLAVATGWLLLRTRSRAALVLFSTSIVAMAVPPLFFGVAVRETLSYILNGLSPPADPSWSFVADHYWPAVRHTVAQDLRFPVHHWGVLPGILFLALVGTAVAMLVFRSPRRDVFFSLHRWALVGGLVELALAPNDTSLRLELVFVPPLAVGAALSLRAAHSQIRRRVPAVGSLPSGP